MTTADLARHLRVHVSTVYRMLSRHELPAFKVGSDWRFNLVQIDEWTKRKVVGK